LFLIIAFVSDYCCSAETYPRVEASLLLELKELDLLGMPLLQKIRLLLLERLTVSLALVSKSLVNFQHLLFLQVRTMEQRRVTKMQGASEPPGADDAKRRAWVGS
jgi:hypothetical protein